MSAAEPPEASLGARAAGEAGGAGASIARLAPWLLEVTVDVPDRPWRRAVGAFAKRRDAENFVRSYPANKEGQGAPTPCSPNIRFGEPKTLHVLEHGAPPS